MIKVESRGTFWLMIVVFMMLIMLCWASINSMFELSHGLNPPYKNHQKLNDCMIFFYREPLDAFRTANIYCYNGPSVKFNFVESEFGLFYILLKHLSVALGFVSGCALSLFSILPRRQNYL